MLNMFRAVRNSLLAAMFAVVGAGAAAAQVVWVPYVPTPVIIWQPIYTPIPGIPNYPVVTGADTRLFACVKNETSADIVYNVWFTSASTYSTATIPAYAYAAVNYVDLFTGGRAVPTTVAFSFDAALGSAYIPKTEVFNARVYSPYTYTFCDASNTVASFVFENGLIALKGK